MNKVAVRVMGLVVLAGVVALMVLFSGKSPSEMRFALVPKSVGHPYWEGVREGMEAAAKRLHVKALFHGPPEASVEEQLKIIEDLMTQGYDGIGISPNDPNAVKEIIKRAMAKGIAIVTFDSDSPDSDRLLYIGTDNREAGRVAGRQMIRLLGAKKKGEATEELLVQIIGGQPGAWNLNERTEGFKQAVAGTNIALCDLVYNYENPDTSLQAAENAIHAHPKLRGFFCSNAFGGPGAALAIKGAIQRGKLEPHQIRVVAFDTTDDILNYIEQGIIDCTLAQQTRRMGALTLEKLLEFANGYAEVHEFAAPPEGADVVDTGVSVVLPKDVSQYRAKPAKAPQAEGATTP